MAGIRTHDLHSESPWTFNRQMYSCVDFVESVKYFCQTLFSNTNNLVTTVVSKMHNNRTILFFITVNNVLLQLYIPI